MKVLILTKNYKPSTIPDAKRFTGIAEFLVDQGHEVTIITESNAEDTKGVKVKRCKPFGRDSYGMLERLVNHSSFMIQSFFKSFSVGKIDVVISTSPPLFNLISGGWIAKIKKSRYIVDLRDIWPDVFEQTEVLKKSSYIYKMFARVAKKAYKRADIIAVVTPGKKKLLQTKLPNYASKVHLLSNGFNRSILEHENQVEISDKFNGFFNVVYTGKIGLAQDLKSYLKLAKSNIHNQTIKFHIFGSGKDEDKILDIISNENLYNIEFYGYRSEAEIATALRGAQVSYVSLSNDKLIDSIPSKLYETLAFGCPVLLSAVGDSADLVKELSYGMVSKPNCYADLERNFEYILNNYEEFLERKQFTIDFMIENYSREVSAKLYDALIRC